MGTKLTTSPIFDPLTVFQKNRAKGTKTQTTRSQIVMQDLQSTRIYQPTDKRQWKGSKRGNSQQYFGKIAQKGGIFINATAIIKETLTPVEDCDWIWLHLVMKGSPFDTIIKVNRSSEVERWRLVNLVLPNCMVLRRHLFDNIYENKTNW